jgi:hypothetical protein
MILGQTGARHRCAERAKPRTYTGPRLAPPDARREIPFWLPVLLPPILSYLFTSRARGCNELPPASAVQRKADKAAQPPVARRQHGGLQRTYAYRWWRGRVRRARQDGRIRS